MPDAAQKVRYWVRHFDGVLILLVQGAKLRYLLAGNCRPARAARDFFKDFGFFALKFYKIFWPAGPPPGSLAGS